VSSQILICLAAHVQDFYMIPLNNFPRAQGVKKKGGQKLEKKVKHSKTEIAFWSS
jgi:hypothetical protein